MTKNLQTHGSHMRKIEIWSRRNGWFFLSHKERQKANPSNHAKTTKEDCKVGPEDYLVQNCELIKDSTLVNYQIHPTVFQSHPQPTKVMRTTSIMELSWMKLINL